MNFKKAIAKLKKQASEDKYLNLATQEIKNYTTEPAVFKSLENEEFPMQFVYNVFGKNGKREVSVFLNADGTSDVEDLDNPELSSKDVEDLESVANLFHSMLKQASYHSEEDAKKDPYRSFDKKTIFVDRTDEIGDVVDDSLKIIILLERLFQGFHSNNSTEDKLAERVCLAIIRELGEMTEKLSSDDILKFDLDTEVDGMEELFSGLSIIEQALKYSWEEIKKTVPKDKVENYLKQLADNFYKLQDLIVSQSDFLEYAFMDDETKMLEQDDVDPDQLSEEDLHPDTYL